LVNETSVRSLINQYSRDFELAWWGTGYFGPKALQHWVGGSELSYRIGTMGAGRRALLQGYRKLKRGGCLPIRSNGKMYL